jgi:hypothetical protein
MGKLGKMENATVFCGKRTKIPPDYAFASRGVGDALGRNIPVIADFVTTARQKKMGETLVNPPLTAPSPGQSSISARTLLTAQRRVLQSKRTRSDTFFPPR